MIYDKQDTLGCHGNEKTQIETQDSMHRQTPHAATTIQQDLDRIMANNPGKSGILAKFGIIPKGALFPEDKNCIYA
jgi:hypothetical protein